MTQQKIQIPLGLGSYESTALQFSAQRCINLFAAVAREQSLNETALFGTPGIVSFSDLGIDKSRGSAVMAGVYYAVSAQTLYSIDQFGVKTSIGTITGDVRIKTAHNGEKLVILVPGGNAYVYNATTDTLVQITDVDFRTSDSVCFKDGFYIFTETNTNVFFNSALNDPLTYDALDFGTAELAPGPIIGCHVNYDELFILKIDNTEPFQNVGGSGFPFQRIPGASYEKGTHSKYSPIEWEGSFYFLGGGVNEKTTVLRAGETAEPENISTDAIDQEIQKFTVEEISKSFSFTYSLNGFSFVGFTLESINVDPKTFVFNITASKLTGRSIWLEQQSGISDNAWRVSTINNIYNKLIVSDIIDGRIGYLDPDTYTEYGNTILRLKTTGPLSEKSSSLIVSKLELVVNSGVGLITGQGSDPQVMMEFSNDGARTWIGEFWRPIGKIGEYLRRTVWRRLGRVPANRVWSFKVSDPVQVVFIKIIAEVEIVQ
jgi:hypothetical protein